MIEITTNKKERGVIIGWSMDAFNEVLNILAKNGIWFYVHMQDDHDSWIRYYITIDHAEMHETDKMSSEDFERINEHSGTITYIRI